MEEQSVQENDISKIPQKSAGDHVHKAIRIAASGIPVVGGCVTEIFTAIITPPLERRRDEWVQSIAVELINLKKVEEGFSIDKLSDNESFITTVTHATQAAIRNHQKEKIEALRNAVLNSAMPNPPNDDLQLIFINQIDILTPWHLRLLALLDNPIEIGKQKGVTYPNWQQSSRKAIVEYIYPELKDKPEFTSMLAKDLFNRGLISTDTITVGMLHIGLFQSCTTTMGKQFIEFIKHPLSSTKH